MTESWGGFGPGGQFQATVKEFRVYPAVRTTRAKMHTDPAYLRYAAMKDELKAHLISLVNESGGSMFLGVPLVVRLTIGKTRTGKFGVMACDIDNLAKSVLDSMNGIVFADDREVVELHVRKVGVIREFDEYVLINVEEQGVQNGEEEG
jgi:Holliday junction resolvase RusA-like endonuclease